MWDAVCAGGGVLSRWWLRAGREVAVRADPGSAGQWTFTVPSAEHSRRGPKVLVLAIPTVGS